MNTSVSRRSLLGGSLGLMAAGALTSVGGAATASAAAFVTLAPSNATSDDITAAAYLLRAHGYLSGTMPTSWTSTFASALAQFKSSRKLSLNGVIDSATLNALIYPVSYGKSSPSGVYALQHLLRKHGYVISTSGITGSYGIQTNRDVQSFQTGHGLARSTTASTATFRALFSPVDLGPLFAVRQAGTGNASSTNCGPTSMLACLLFLGIHPSGWTGFDASRVPAINYLRYTAIGLPNTSDSRYAYTDPYTYDRNSLGTEFPDLAKGFGHFGLNAWQGGVDDNIRTARQGRPSICGGDAKALPWSNLSGHWSHWIAVLGFDGTYYRVVDPDSPATNDIVHLITESQLRNYAATNPGYGNTDIRHSRMAPPSRNSVLI